jgi:DNA-binding response OmpR family regulator
MEKKKIMIVDDEGYIVELLKTVLRGAGFEVITAIDGKQCLKKLKKVKPDMILMDFMMPGMTGVDTIKKIRANPETKDLKVAFLTVKKVERVGIKEVDELNVIDYITKPFDNDELVERVKMLLE